MTQETIEVPKTVMDSETMYVCDSCGLEVMKEKAVPFENGSETVDDLHFHVECLDNLGILTKPPELSAGDVLGVSRPTLVLDRVDLAAALLGMFGMVTIGLGLGNGNWGVAFGGVVMAVLFFSVPVLFGREQASLAWKKLRKKRRKWLRKLRRGEPSWLR